MERSCRGSQGEGAPEAACEPYGPGDGSEASCPSTSGGRREQVRRPGASAHRGGAEGEAGVTGRACQPRARLPRVRPSPLRPEGGVPSALPRPGQGRAAPQPSEENPARRAEAGAVGERAALQASENNAAGRGRRGGKERGPPCSRLRRSIARRAEAGGKERAALQPSEKKHRAAGRGGRPGKERRPRCRRLRRGSGVTV